MSFTIQVKEVDGQFSAVISGDVDEEVVRPTREAAVLAAAERLRELGASGELPAIQTPKLGAAGVAGVFADDPTLSEICADIYAERYRDRDSLPT